MTDSGPDPAPTATSAGGTLPAVIFLNGTSSSGKTTVARAVQDLSPVPYLYWGLDTFFGSVPRRWSGGPAGPLSFEGFRYERATETDATGVHPVVRVVVGPQGLAMLESTYRAVGVLGHSYRLIIDEMLLRPELLDIWREVLPQNTLFVGLHCALDVLEKREQDRKSPRGLARGHLHTVHADPNLYDVTLDTTDHTPEELAGMILTPRPRSREEQ